MLEREPELGVLRDAIELAVGGVGSTVLIEGPAGIGKTTLLAAATEIASEHGVLARVARAGQLEREMPFGVARQLLEPLVERAAEQERSRLLAGSAALSLAALGRAGDGERQAEVDPFAAIHGLYWLLANLAETEPVILVVDDAQWADGQSLRWLDFVARRASDTEVLLVISARTGEADEPAELESLRVDATSAIRPSALSGAAVEELIGAAFDGAPPEGLSDACNAATGGNPFLLAELLRTLRSGGDGPLPELAGEVDSMATETVIRSVRRRIEPFGEDALELARAVAVLGGAPQLRHVAALAGIDEDRARGLCDRLRAAEILAAGHPIDFVHPLVRAAIYQELSEEVRAGAHRRAAALLSATGAEAREVAPHLLNCSPNGDPWVVDQLRGAALEAIMAGSPVAAVRYLERALAEPPDDEAQVTFELGNALRAAQHPDSPAVLESAAAKSARPGLRLKALASAALGHVSSGDFELATRNLDLLASSTPDDQIEHRLRTEATLLLTSIYASGRDPRRADRVAELVAGTDAHTAGERMVRQALSLDLFLACEPVDQVVELASCFPPYPWTPLGPLPGYACLVLAGCGQWEMAREGCLRGYGKGPHFAAIAAALEGLVAATDFAAGRLADSEAEARTALEIQEGSHSLATLGAASCLVGVLILRGRPQEAERLAEQEGLSPSFTAAPMLPMVIDVRGDLELSSGALESRAEDVLALGEEIEQAGVVNPAAIAWRQEVAPALVALGRSAEAVEIVAEGERRARAFGAAHAIGTMLRARASTEPEARAIETLGESVALLGESGPPHELARSCLELGATLRRSRRRRESREPLREALELAHLCGADGLAERAREELAAAGSRPRSVMRTGVESLTASELRAARLAAQGLSNVEIAQSLYVTRKTVEKHLGNAYSKLEIGSREELAGALEGSSPR